MTEPDRAEQAAIQKLGLYVEVAYKLPFKEVYAFKQNAPILPLVPEMEFGTRRITGCICGWGGCEDWRRAKEVKLEVYVGCVP